MNCWDMPKKTWSKFDEKITIARNDNRLSVTLYAAISPNALTEPVYYITTRTTNEEDFCLFLR